MVLNEVLNRHRYRQWVRIVRAARIEVQVVHAVHEVNSLCGLSCGHAMVIISEIGLNERDARVSEIPTDGAHCPAHVVRLWG